MKEQPMKETPNVKPVNMDDDIQKPSFYETLKQKRDELRLQSHLFSKEAQHTWSQLEGDWNLLSTRVRERQNDIKDSSSKIYSELKSMAEDMKKRYDQFKKDIKH